MWDWGWGLVPAQASDIDMKQHNGPTGTGDKWSRASYFASDVHRSQLKPDGEQSEYDKEWAERSRLGRSPANDWAPVP
jgi:hypothetical protein